ncbi:hypothetical protein [Quatrionicoccus australiensis]|uniref:hypothetical protein n=1 Tax=Quatrionicoccus australiensis TaxID=138118 RepID=UPI001CF85A88|nr:hypothetical protein [Quatrionicoccus australiensis]UCV16986.1 hypothetical protein KI612_10080 [Quatrionicoccus australiensis]
MNNQSSSPALAHLTPMQIHSLIHRYYSGEKVATLITEYDIECTTSELCRQFPPECVGRDCPVCNSPLIKPRVSRTRSSGSRHAAIRCSRCSHQETEKCVCPNCREIRTQKSEAQRQREREAITTFCSENWSYSITQIKPEQLGAETAIALLSLIRCGGWLNDSTIDAIASSAVPFVPNEISIAPYLLGVLFDNGLIAPALNSRPSSFYLAADEKARVDWHAVYWSLRIPEAPVFIEKLEILAASDSWPNGWKADMHALWKMLAMAECKEFCMHAVAQRKLPMPGETALTALLENLLRSFSVSQCYQLIWNAAGRAVDYMIREKIKAQHASNALIGSCQRYADRARSEGWNLKGFQRNFDLPRSQLSYVLHDVFLKHGDIGFYGALTTSS